MSTWIRLLVLCLLVVPPATRAKELPVPAGQAGEVKEVVFKTTPQGELKIYLHFPKDWKASDKRPAAVFFFGGGWRSGNVKQFEPQATYLASRGMVTARADYRVKSRHQTTPDKCVEDCKSAVRWLRQHASQLGIDPERIAAGGGSAGGHTAAATATVSGLEGPGEDHNISSRPNLLLLFNPALDTTIAADRFASEAMARQCSPLHQLSKDAPPTIVFFGTNDRLLEGARAYQAKARKLGVEVQLYLARDQKHGFFNRGPWLSRTIYQMDLFLAQQGYLKGKPTLNPPREAQLVQATGDAKKDSKP
jgi:acetyl esterase